MSSLKSYQNELIEASMSNGALKFGSFALKSGRTSPYFFNAGLLCSGPILSTVSAAYAATIVAALNSPTPFPKFDILFGPAYKGIPFAACTALQLHNIHNIPIGFAYDRKEAKVHGEGGNLVGVPVKGKRVVILDDVMTAGTAVRAAIDLITNAGGEVVGVVQLLDREEVGKDGVTSAVTDIEGLLGKGRFQSILKMKDLVVWLEEKGMQEEVDAMREYRDQYGLKE